MPIKLANNASTRLATPITALSTTITSESGGGDKFPITGDDVYYPMTLVASDGSLEIVRCTARSGDTFTVERAQEGTTAKDFTAGSVVELRFTAGAVEAVMDELGDTVDQAKQDLEDRIAEAEGFAVGDYLTTARDPGSNWRRRNGATLNVADYPELSELFPPLPSGLYWSAMSDSGLTIPNGIPTALSNGELAVLERGFGTAKIQISRDYETFELSQTISTVISFTSMYAAYGNGKYVVIGGSPSGPDNVSRGFTSTDGVTWSMSSYPTGAAPAGLIFFNGLFIAFTPRNKSFHTSPDGQSWTQRTVAFSSEIGGQYHGNMCVHNGVLCVLHPDSSETDVTSSDGITFTRTSRSNGGIMAICSDGTQLIGVGDAGRIATTPSFSSAWTNRTSGTTQALYSVATDGGNYVAVGNSGTTIMSEDAVTWRVTGAGLDGTLRYLSVNPNLENQFVCQAGSVGVHKGTIESTPAFKLPEDNPTNGWIKAL